MNTKADAHARAFIKRLPESIYEPSVHVEETGEISFAWSKRESDKITLFSVVFDGDWIIFALFKDSNRTNNYGQLGFCDESIDKVLIDIKQHFSLTQEPLEQRKQSGWRPH